MMRKWIRRPSFLDTFSELNVKHNTQAVEMKFLPTEKKKWILFHFDEK